MDRDIYIVTESDEFNVGKVGDILMEVDDHGEQSSGLVKAMRDIIDGMVFNDDETEWADITIEIR